MHLDTIYQISKKINFERINKCKIENILINGSSGFIGTYLINSLLMNKKRKIRIYGIDKFKPNILVNNKNYFHFYKKDLMNLRLFKFKKKLDLIIHLAGIPSPTYYKKKPFETFYLNCELAKIFLDLAYKKKSKFVYFSSSEIYGNPDKNNIPTKENYEGRVSSVGDRSCYDESKRAGETYTKMFKDIYGTDCKIIRPFNFYGEGMKQNDKRVIPQFFNTGINLKKIMPFSNGRQTRTYCHIIDAIPQIINVCFFGKSFIYNIGNDKNEISALMLAKKIKKTLNDKVTRIKKINYPKFYPSNEPLRRCPDISKIKKEFNYKPSITIDKGLKLFSKYALKIFTK
jgi:UDP-glucuronate decarboxylase